MKRIGVFTSGGDAPGMNAAIRAVVRAGIYKGLEVIGIRRGFDGMMEGDFVQMSSDSVSNIIQRGGTVLKTSRSKKFMTVAGMKEAAAQLKKSGIEGLVAIGGDGTFKGAIDFAKHCRIPVVGVPGTIDNDLAGTDFTIGYDTALNTVVELVDKIKDTAYAHSRLFFIEVMGRDAGHIALNAGIATGADCILIPETKTSVDDIVRTLKNGRQKTSNIILVAEGDEEGNAMELAKKFKRKLKHIETRVSILGHIQRGGSPTCTDRVLASRLGVAAVEALLNGKTGGMLGVRNSKLNWVPFSKAIKDKDKLDRGMVTLSEILF